MIERGSGGSIVNIVSIAGLRPQYQRRLYSLSKAGPIMMTKTWAQQLDEHKQIRVNAIAPAPIQTDFSAFSHQNPQRLKSLERTQPLPPIRTTNELAYTQPVVPASAKRRSLAAERPPHSCR